MGMTWKVVNTRLGCNGDDLYKESLDRGPREDYPASRDKRKSRHVRNRDFSHYLRQTLCISALASAPSRPPNPTLTIQNQAFSNKQKSVQKSQKPKKPGVLTVNIIPISHKSAKIAIFSCQKSRVPNKI